MASPVFVELQTDAFSKNVKTEAELAQAAAHVRRPTRGFEIKEDTYATIRILRSDGTPIPLVDSGGAFEGPDGKTYSTSYTNFIIQNIQDDRQEKSQVLETFGDSYIFFFGERPRILRVDGILMNTRDFNWRTEFWHNYETYLRGTKLVEQDARIYLHYDDVLVEGYMLGATAIERAEMPYHIQFGFTLFVTNHQYLSMVGQKEYPIRHYVELKPFLTHQNTDAARDVLMSHGVQVSESESLRNTIANAMEKAQSYYYPAQAIVGATVTGGAEGFGSAATLLAAIEALRLTEEKLSKQPPVPRTIPYRSAIRDNVDEYMEPGVDEWQSTMPSKADMVYMSEYKTPEDVKPVISTELIELGVAGMLDFSAEVAEFFEGDFSFFVSPGGPTFRTASIKTTGYGHEPHG